MKEIIVEFQKIVPEGKSLGKFNGKVVFAYGILPYEKARVRIIKEKKNYLEAELCEIIEKSKDRIDIKEDHYLSCSPWQGFNYEKQIEIKENLLKEIYFQYLRKEIEINGFEKAKKIFGYRTKIEFSFLKEDKIYLAFYKRGSNVEKIKLENGCILGSEKMNLASLKIVERLNNINFPFKDLKGFMIRESKRFNKRLGVLFLLNKNMPKIDLVENLDGLILVYSFEKSPAFVFTEILNKIGDEFLKEKILDLEIYYGPESFFQNNIDLFEKVLIDIKNNCDKVNKIVELYSGVGSIILNLKDYSKKIYGVEIVKEACDFAQISAEMNNIKNFKIINLAAEKLDFEFLKNTNILVLDPPRTGLHKKVINLILSSLPQKIIYLSCNPITQARDYSLLKEKYKIKFLKGYDFYPNTPHMESLLILERI